MAHTAPIRVILIDDHRHVHEIVSTLIQGVDDIELVAQGSNGEEAIRLCQEFHPDLVVMDVVMPGLDGIAATRIVREKYPNVRVLALSSFQDHETIWGMLEAGASGYVLKGELTGDLIHTIHTTFEGKTVFSEEVVKQILHSASAEQPGTFNLTEREIEILRLMAGGENNPAIAYQLSISQSTVKFHITNILSKMDVETRSEALVLAAKSGLL
jgi:NarL family two-component system response regulator LiaR